LGGAQKLEPVTPMRPARTGVHHGTLLRKSSTGFQAVETRAHPALIIYTMARPAPKALGGAPPIIGNIPGFVHSHHFFAAWRHKFWSLADWAWAGGLFDALLPSWYFGVPILGYRGRFDAEKAYYLLEKYGVRNSFLFPTALKLMMKAVSSPRTRFNLSLRSIMSAGESVGVTVLEWAKEHLGHHQRDVRPDRDQPRGRQLPGRVAGGRLVGGHTPAIA
jgi:acetyl-CoA synthetase